MQYEYALGTVEVDENGTSVRTAETLTKGEYENLLACVNSVQKLEPSFHYKLVEKNYRDLVSIHSFATRVVALRGRQHRSDPRLVADSTLISIINWVTAMRLFLDYEESQLKRQYGKAAPEVGAYKDAASRAFDDLVGYRFAYKFRNYVQHCGLPPYSITARLPEDGSEAPMVELALNRDELLDAYDSWGRVKQDLSQMAAEFPLVPLIEEAMEGIRHVQRACQDIRLDTALAGTSAIRSALDRISNSDEGSPVVVAYGVTESGTIRTMTPTVLPEQGVAILEQISESATPRGVLHLSQRHEPAPLEPQSVRGVFDKHHRAIGLLVSALEGTDRSRLATSMNEAIQLDGGNPGPVLGGLLSVSMTLSHMTASLLGISPQALVSGFLEEYGREA